MQSGPFRQFVEKRRTWYKSVGRVFCPCLNEYVIFNSKGFRHLIYNGLGVARARKESIGRLRILPLAIPTIRKAITFAEFRELYSSKEAKWIKSWELQEIVGKDKVKISIILRKIGDGKIAFYSIWEDKK